MKETWIDSTDLAFWKCNSETQHLVSKMNISDLTKNKVFFKLRLTPTDSMHIFFLTATIQMQPFPSLKNFFYLTHSSGLSLFSLTAEIHWIITSLFGFFLKITIKVWGMKGKWDCQFQTELLNKNICAVDTELVLISQILQSVLIGVYEFMIHWLMDHKP